ncbi:MAG: CBM35 domain-containing protein, partial [Lachnospiraceae bacterium]
MKRGRKALSIGLAVVLGVTAVGCGTGKDSGQQISENSGAQQVEENSGGQQVAESSREPFIPETIGIYEAEDAQWNGNVKAVDSPAKEGYSGTGYVEGFQADDDRCIFTVSIPEDGFYDLNFISASGGGEKHNYVSVDGEQMGTVFVEESGFTDSILNRVYMSAGEHEVDIAKYWGWISLDCLEVLTS